MSELKDSGPKQRKRGVQKKRKSLQINTSDDNVTTETLASGSTPATPLTPSGGRRKKTKTKFPLARIKRIIQADEDVGKISSATPVLISKCLELFIADLVKACEKVTKSKQAKTMTVVHLKECIEKETTFDFLLDKVKNVQAREPKEKKPKKQKKKKSEEEEEGGEEEEEDEEAGDL